MGQASRFLRNASGAWHEDHARAGLAHWCPACEETHIYWIEGDRKKGPVWGFNGNLDRPTFTPSMLITYSGKDAGQVGSDGDRAPPARCHYFLTDGVLHYCPDSSHGLAGQKVPLPELPKHLQDNGEKAK